MGPRVNETRFHDARETFDESTGHIPSRHRTDLAETPSLRHLSLKQTTPAILTRCGNALNENIVEQAEPSDFHRGLREQRHAHARHQNDGKRPIDCSPGTDSQCRDYPLHE
jgi:hypothetical protein